MWQAQLGREFWGFMLSKQRVGWLYTDVCGVYVRKGNRLIDGKITTTLDIANVAVMPEHRGKGHGDFILEFLHASHPYEATYIEQVLNPRWAEHLKKREWRLLEIEGTPSFYRHKEAQDGIPRRTDD